MIQFRLEHWPLLFCSIFLFSPLTTSVAPFFSCFYLSLLCTSSVFFLPSVFLGWWRLMDRYRSITLETIYIYKFSQLFFLGACSFISQTIDLVYCSLTAYWSKLYLFLTATFEKKRIGYIALGLFYCRCIRLFDQFVHVYTTTLYRCIVLFIILQ
jgi:hypothetical protein